MLSKPIFDAMLSLSMIVVVALVWGGLYLVRTGTDKRRGWLMLGAALVLLANVLLWSLPA